MCCLASNISHWIQDGTFGAKVIAFAWDDNWKVKHANAEETEIVTNNSALALTMGRTALAVFVCSFDLSMASCICMMPLRCHHALLKHFAPHCGGLVPVASEQRLRTKTHNEGGKDDPRAGLEGRVVSVKGSAFAKIWTVALCLH